MDFVALLAEGVDRNTIIWYNIDGETQSPSSRRAWIEIQVTGFASDNAEVALLAEGVDRNAYVPFINKFFHKSPSSRRAWIEIKCGNTCRCTNLRVALLAEGVDRNIVYLSATDEQRGRPPRGGCG